MKKMFAAAVATITMSGISFAADLGSRSYVKASTIASAAYDWSGIYVGANAGYGTSEQCWSTPNTPSFGCNTAGGALAGGQIGYRWQLSHWVVGLEAQGDWARLSGGHPDPFNPALLLKETKAGFGMFSGQLGYGIGDMLVYAKGGVVVSSVHYDAESPDNPFFTERTGILKRWNRTIGGGIEYGWSKNWSTGLEYNHIFGNKFDERFFRADGLNEVAYIKGDIDLVTIRLNYHFD